MGVPGFFVWLMKNNPRDNIIVKSLDCINNLYFDANCLFHPKCFDILKLYSNITDNDKLEDLMIARILKYMQYIIDYVKPSDKIYISVDGVAPVAKINQQRKRRYKSVIDMEFTNKINKKYGVSKNTSWSNIVITPGTPFMKKLDSEIIKYFKENKKVIYSSYKECGEGEHKIIRYIKQNSKKQRHVIYGLDADLIFLSMSAQSSINEIYLLRELQHLKKINMPIMEDVAEPLCYLSIQNVIETYNGYILNKLRENATIIDLDLSRKYDFSKDFIILCFMLGNDFIPNLPSIFIRINGIEYIIEAYCRMFENTRSYIYSEGCINWQSLMIVYDYIGLVENEFFTTSYNDYKRMNRYKKCHNINNAYEIELWEHDNLKDIQVDDRIQLGKGDHDEYKFRYYEHTLNSRINQQKMIDKVCKNYLEMITWITRYYFDIEMPSWQYCYYFSNSPFASDLKHYLENHKVNSNIEYKECIRMETQLSAIIPGYYSGYYSETLKESGVSCKYMFPIKYELEYDNKDQYWMCEAKLPVVDFELL